MRRSVPHAATPAHRAALRRARPAPSVHDRVRAKFARGGLMPDTDFDLFVIGGGSGGVRAARMAAQRGAARGARRGGGAGRHLRQRGLHPEEALQLSRRTTPTHSRTRRLRLGRWRDAAPRLARALKRNRARGDRAPERRLRPAARRRRRATLRGRAARDVVGAATPSTVGGGRWRRAHILVATGGWPIVPDCPGARARDLVERDVRPRRRFPRRLVVVGGGYIACEFASIFRGLGRRRSTQLYRGEQVLRGFDDDVRAFVADEMRKKGVDLRLRSRRRALDRDGRRIAARRAARRREL